MTNDASPAAAHFVRSSVEIESFDPKLDEYVKRITAFWEDKVRQSPTAKGPGRALRCAHAKSLGFARAEVQPSGDASPDPQGIYARPRRHDALIRFSSASNHLGADATLGAVLGSAIKVFSVKGSELADEPGSKQRKYLSPWTR